MWLVRVEPIQRAQTLVRTYVLCAQVVAIWELQARLLSSHGSHHDYFGSVLDLDGDTLIIGAGQDDPIGTESGSAYIFVRQGDTWTQQARLYASGGVPGEYFGSSVGISGDTAISGAPGYNDLGHWSGSAYVFIRSGNTWSQQARLLAPDGAPGDTFGVWRRNFTGT